MRLYWQRNFVQEQRLAEQISHLTKRPVAPLIENQSNFLKNCERDHFANYSTFLKRVELLKAIKSTDDPQKLESDLIEHWSDVKSSIDQINAIECLATHAFGIITGGPGTGKTTTVARLLECLLKANPAMKIALAAPTGKATARMQDSIRANLGQDDAIYPILKSIFDTEQVQAHTLHKWLVTPTSRDVLPNPDNPIEFDAFIIDEASMIDSGLALRFFECIDTQKARVYLLGDKYQLAAVGPGAIFAELTDDESPVASFVGRLNVSHRFTDDSKVGALSRSINAGQYNALQNVLDGKTLPRLDYGNEPIENLDRIKNWLSLNTTPECEVEALSRTFVHSRAKDAVHWEKVPTIEKLQKWLTPHLDKIIDAVKALAAADNEKRTDCLKRLWDATESFRVLASNRHGYLSVDSVNAWADQYIRKQLNVKDNNEFYAGKMIIVRLNSDELNVFNGDVGVVCSASDDPDNYQVIFDSNGKRSLSTGLLPRYDLAYAMTIHQSQGSDYESVAVLLPEEPDSPLATRELLYTGVTRAKKEVTVFAKPSVLQTACEHCTIRQSGLKARLTEEIYQ